MSTNHPVRISAPPRDPSETPTEGDMSRALVDMLVFLMRRYPELQAANLQLVFQVPTKGLRHQSRSVAVEAWTRDPVLLAKSFHNMLLKQGSDLKATEADGFAPFVDPADLRRNHAKDC